MNANTATLTPEQVKTLTFEKPAVEDGRKMWKLVNDCGLDLNSSYKYIMMCEFFAETCVVAKEDDNVVGFVTAFIPPEKQDTVFVWQIGVDESQKGRGLASKILFELLDREACADVRYLEATVTPSNTASQNLFKGMAKKLGTKCKISECFAEELFPGEGHEEELTFRIGPIKK
ncbi:diaminobutyrate acetyltransferase [Salsuginibacillus halophilus]|uniref:L-2,4-diaminobutyric acid acetyltransferase n=1 Tax=Salsuginibacillus halophilus TaxID=517424 RepID=A0A2P8HBN6_9BACI|nr:diaminobutyrate acetyltransferase [Salsuginibacillus halophilus]PSL43639.1 diaminobutyrate acetyltransferase [Salsuginibacillus halophilus]